MTQVSNPICPRCGNPLPAPNALACPNCGALVYGAALAQLSAEAKWQEQYNPARAIALWEECLKYLPPEAGQYTAVQQEINRLRAASPSVVPAEEPGSIPQRRQETLSVAVLKTGISMIISIVLYKFSFGWAGAFGFVLLILVHEMGHVFANLHYGIKASPPIFIPYLGAVINLRQNPPNARVEAVIGIAGPVAGTIASLVCYGLFIATHSPITLVLAWFGFTMNLFNLLPVPPLDGGRVAAAISPWFWVAGLAGLGWLLFDELSSGSSGAILVLILVFAIPRIIKTLKPAGRSGPYYNIGKKAPVVIGAAFLLLLGILFFMRWYTARQLPHGPLF